MFYKGPEDRVTRALRRLFVVKCFKGSPDAKKPKYEKVKVIAWNQTDAIRRVLPRKVAELPEPECYVTWDDQPLKIHDTSGPTDELADPDVGAVSEEDFTK